MDSDFRPYRARWEAMLPTERKEMLQKIVQTFFKEGWKGPSIKEMTEKNFDDLPAILCVVVIPEMDKSPL